MEPSPTSRIYLSHSALARNLRFVQARVGHDTLVSSVVKGNAYGHGIEEFVPLAESLGVRHFSVADSHEAARVLASKRPDTSVMIMAHLGDDELGWAISSGVEFYVFDIERLEAALEAAASLERRARIHIQLETGMHRLGYENGQIQEVIDLLKRSQGRYVLEGITTHLAGAESINNYHRIQQQLERYQDALQRFRSAFTIIGRRHVASSAAAFVYPNAIYDMVRIGVAQYGFWPSEETRIRYLNMCHKLTDTPLRRVMSWKTSVMGLKMVERGEFVGYGTSYIAPRRMRIATVPVGYSHGYSRVLSNRGYVLVRGRRAHVTGVVNMNMMTVDVTNIPDVARGDEVVLIGKQGNQTISVGSFSEMTNQVNYELLARLPHRIPRIPAP
ncbi:MAG: alanine racemase [Candidatus Eisenbacteria bacterium]|nr:alanine racemase [Candidatus Eisenbacteria bacterium]